MHATILLVGRILFGGFFLYNGINHFRSLEALAGYAASRGVPAPEAAVVASGLLILLGGLSVLLGIAPRVGLLLILAFLVPVTLTMHPFWNVPDAQARSMELSNFLKNTALAGAALGWMALAVPWPYAIDEAIRRRWPGWARWTALERPVHQS